MKPKKIKTLVTTKVNGLAGHCEKIKDGFDKEDIHDFRVAIKSLRSFLMMLNMQAGEKELKLPGKLKLLYHISGAMRDATLEMELLELKKDELPFYIDKQQKMLARQKKEWAKHYSKKIFTKLERRVYGFDYQPLMVQTFTGFFVARVAAIDELCKIQSPANEQVHSIRKHLKDMLYNAKTVQKNWKDAAPYLIDMPVKKIEGLAAEIGNYNDRRITLQKMNSFSSNAMRASEKKAIKAMCGEWNSILKKEKKIILENTRALLNSMPSFLSVESPE
jgi:CHAD domain-containing protein